MTESAPTSWPELLASQALVSMRENAQSNSTMLPRVARMGNPVMVLGAAPRAQCAVAISDGPDAARKTLEALRPAIELALPRLQPDVSSPMPAIGVLGLLAVAEGCGLAGLTPEKVRPRDLIGAVVRGRRGLTEQELHRAAFAALGTGEVKLVSELLGSAPAAGDFTPGRTFGFNAVGFLEYAAHGREIGARADALRPAFESFVAAFPRKLGAGTLEWTDLLWSARAVLHGLGGLSPPEALKFLHAHVRGA